MKKTLLIFLTVLALVKTNAQQNQWSYDFGTTAVASYTSSTYSYNYLPVPQLMGGSAGAAASNGQVEMVTTNNAGGSGAELKVTGGPTLGAKFGLSQFLGTTLATFQCKVNIASGATGNFVLYFGNGSGFSTATNISVPQTFTGLRFSPNSGSTVSLAWLSGSPTYTTLATSINKNQSYQLRFFMNNSNNDETYIFNSSTHFLLKGTFDIWLDNTKILANADPATTNLPQGTIVNSMNFQNVTAGTGMVAYLDDISYTNYLTPPTAPTGINTLQQKYLNWLTGYNLDFSNPQVLTRYNSFLSTGNAARNLSAYNFTTPGAVWDFENDADAAEYSTLVEQKLIRLVYLYKLRGPNTNASISFQSRTLKDTILTIFNYLKAKGVTGSADFEYDVYPATEEVITSSHGISLRSSAYATSVLLMKDELKTAGEYMNQMSALQGLTYFMDPNFPYFTFANPGYNTDVIRSAIQQRFCYVLAQDDTSTSRLANMDHLKAFINNAYKTGNGWNDCIKPDFITFHHRGAYANTYGSQALHQGAILNLMLAGTPYELDATAKSNIKQAIFAYNKFSKGFEMPRALAGRFPFDTDPLNELRPALSYLYAADPIGNLDTGREFVRLWGISGAANTSLQQSNTVSIAMVNTLGGMQDMATALNSGLTALPEKMEGQFNFPYAGLSVHKYNGYQVSMKGTSKNIWHFENGTNENVFGRYVSAGSMEILAVGNPVTHAVNGYVENGWDWARIPGVTAAYIPVADFSTTSTMMRLFSGRSMLAHASLDSVGAFAMDYRDANSATSMTALKSAFFFKDKVLCLGSSIRNDAGTYPIQTTLFQTALPDVNTPTYVNGTAATGNSYTFNQNGGGLWATDAVGNGYVVPAIAANAGNVNSVPTITVQRTQQTSRDNGNVNTTTGNFATAYINHGIAPNANADSKYAYGVIMQGGQTGTADFATNFDNYFQIFNQNSSGHAVKYIPDSIYAYAVFNPVGILYTNDVVIRVDKQAIIMTQKLNGGNKIKVSLTNPNLGLLSAGENYNYNQISGSNTILNRAPQVDVVKLIIRGNWTLETPMSTVSTTLIDDSTEIAFSTINGLTIQTQLVPVQVLPLSVQLSTTPAGIEGQILHWSYVNDGRQIKNLVIEKSLDGKNWGIEASRQAGATSHLFKPESPTYVKLVVVHKDGSRLTSNIIRVSASNQQLTNIRISPNPATNVVTIRSSSVSIKVQQIINAAGTNVKSQVSVRSTAGSAVLNIDRLPRGVYVVELLQNDVRKTVKFVKQ